MNKIRQYIPAFVTGFENEEVSFNTTEDLLEIGFVKNFSKLDNFYQYSISDNALMAEYKDGRSWWVVGFIDKLQEVSLPKWEPGIDINETDGGVEVEKEDEIGG